MDNIIKINAIDKQNIDKLHTRFVKRYMKEKGRYLTNHDSNLCWCSICGAFISGGYENAEKYVDTVKLED